MSWTPAEQAALAAICQTLAPALTPAADDHPALFALDALALGLPAALQTALAQIDPRQQLALRALLRALQQPWLPALLVGRAQPISALPLSERERLLQRMASHPVPQLRAAFQGLKRLTLFLFYSLLDDHGQNPAWPALGYHPIDPPAAPALLQPMVIGRDATLHADVCVIGSGAGGSVVAAELAARGRHVVVLEAGGGDQAPDFCQRELIGMQRLYLDGGMTATRDLSVALLAGATLGGGTTVNWQAALRLPEAIREEWAARSGCDVFTDEAFTAAYAAVEARLCISTAETLVNANNAHLRDGCRALGYRWQPIPRNAHDCDPQQCSFCVFGCRHGGKQSTARTYLVDAQRAGATIVVHCRAERVLLEHGRVTGVLATAYDPQTGRRSRVTVRAPGVVVAAGALHSPALLLRSGVTLPHIGRHLYLHPTSAVAGVYPTAVATWQGPPMSIMVDQWAFLDGLYGFRLETVPAHPGLMALGTPWFGAASHRREMQRMRNKGAIIVLTRDRQGGRVRLDRRGQPRIDYRLDAGTHALLRRGVAEAVRVHLAAGAHEVLTLHTREHRLRRGDDIEAFCARLMRQPLDRNWSTLFSAHQMGTCRMGRGPRRAVVDADGQVFGTRGLFVADASIFPASSGVNPMLTIMALACCLAPRIAALVPPA